MCWRMGKVSESNGLLGKRIHSSRVPMKELKKILDKIYQPAGLHIHNFETESESQDYGACRFRLDGQMIVFRIAKTTPKKVGQFVVLWKRATSGVIEPFDVKDPVDFFVVAVHTPRHTGQFVFPKDILYEKGILQGGDSEGKRAIRVYSAWDMTTSRQAKNTQAWQLDYFFELTENQEENIFNIQKRYTNDKKF